jgi:hypothetical protein
LRDRVALYELREGASFRLEGEGAPTVARVELLRAKDAPLPTQLEVVVGHASYAVQIFSSGVGFVEVPIGAADTRIEVRAPNGRALARVRYRARSQDDEARLSFGEVLPRREPAAWLDDVDSASKEIARERTNPDEAARARALEGLLARRARALFALGFRWYAYRDWAAAGLSDAAFEALQVEGTARRTVDTAGSLHPFESFDVERVHRRRIELLGQGGGGPLARVEGASERPLLLLKALEAARVGDALRAASAWEAIGEGPSDLEAGREYIRAARDTEGRDLLVRAAALLARAKIALPERADVDVLLERLRPRLEWARAAAADDSAGTRVEVEASDRESLLSPGARVRAALLGAPFLGVPGDAALLFEGEFVSLRFSGAARTVTFEGACMADDPSLPCGFAVRIDGQAPEPVTPGAPIAIAAGSHSFELEPSTRALAWVRIVNPTSAGPARTEPGAGARPAVARRWFVGTPRVPVRFSVRGPSVATVDLKLTEPSVVELRASGTPTRTWRGSAGDEARFDIPFVTDEVGAVEIVPVSGSVLAKFAVAVGAAAAEAPAAHRTSGDVAYLGTLDYHPFTGATRSPGAADGAGPFSWGLKLRSVGADARDLDINAGGAPYFEVNPEIMRAFGSGPVYGHLGALVRLRGGPTSYGARLRIETPGYGLLPRLTLKAGVTTQEFDRAKQSFTAYSARLGSAWRIPLGPVFSLYPVLAARYVEVQSLPAGLFGVDPDVYTFQDDLEPLQVTGELVLYARPLVDVANRFRARAVAFGESKQVDRVEFAASVDAVPGHGLWPWINATYQASYRPETDYRNAAFLRHSIGGQLFFWAWGNATHRIAISTDARYIPDIDLLEWGLTLSYLGAAHRGVMDVPRGDVEHRDRMNENAGVAESLRSGTWGIPGRVGGD